MMDEQDIASIKFDMYLILKEDPAIDYDDLIDLWYDKFSCDPWWIVISDRQLAWLTQEAALDILGE